MMTDEYVTATDLKAIEQRVNREAQQTMQHLITLQGRIDALERAYDRLLDKVQVSVTEWTDQQSTADPEIDYEAVTKAAQQFNADWTDYNPVSDRIRLQAFKAGAEWALRNA